MNDLAVICYSFSIIKLLTFQINKTYIIHRKAHMEMTIYFQILANCDVYDSFFSAVKMFKETGEIFVQKPGEDVPKVFTFDSVYDWK